MAGTLGKADLLSQLDSPAAVRSARAATGTLAEALKTPPSPTSAEDHRARLRARLLSAGPDALADHELLEAVLFLAILRRDTKPIAYRLVARFGSFANAIAAPMTDLLGVEGLGPSGAAALKIVHAAALRLARSEVIDRQEGLL